MTIKRYQIEFLTPAFCAGATQEHAELRAPSIRGALRWWFRALGGSRTEEESVFGAVHGESPTASQIVVRTQYDRGTGEKNWFSEDKIPRQGMDRGAYLLGFFCGRTHRLTDKGALPPGSTATISVILRQTPSPRLLQSLRIFHSIGAIGFRSTRTAGSLCSKEHALTSDSWTGLAAELKTAGFSAALLPETFPNWARLVGHAGFYLKHNLRSSSEGLGIGAGRNGSAANALGSATPRQASVLHFRAVRVDSALRLALIEAPHQRILGRDAKAAHRGRGSILNLAGFPT